MSIGVSKFVLLPYEEFKKLSSNHSNTTVNPTTLISNGSEIDSGPLPTATQAKLLAIQSRFETRPGVKLDTEEYTPSVLETIEEDVIDSTLLGSLSGGKIEKCRQILNLINKSKRVSIIRGVGTLTIDGAETILDINQLLYDLQQPNKTLPADCEPILSVLQLPHYLVANSKAKEFGNEDKKRASKRRWIATA